MNSHKRKYINFEEGSLEFSYNKERESNILNLDINYIIQFIDNKRRKLPKCSGCYPIFQCNQFGHMGFHGCLEEEDIFYFSR